MNGVNAKDRHTGQRHVRAAGLLGGWLPPASGSRFRVSARLFLTHLHTGPFSNHQHKWTSQPQASPIPVSGDVRGL